jgi:hypothetical protein
MTLLGQAVAAFEDAGERAKTWRKTHPWHRDSSGRMEGDEHCDVDGISGPFPVSRISKFPYRSLITGLVSKGCQCPAS